MLTAMVSIDLLLQRALLSIWSTKSLDVENGSVDFGNVEEGAFLDGEFDNGGVSAGGVFLVTVGVEE
jgi:hypothetical protein